MPLHGTEHTHRATSYRQVHDRLVRERGSAVGRPCFGCGRPSTGWGTTTKGECRACARERSRARRRAERSA